MTQEANWVTLIHQIRQQCLALHSIRQPDNEKCGMNDDSRASSVVHRANSSDKKNTRKNKIIIKRGYEKAPRQTLLKTSSTSNIAWMFDGALLFHFEPFFHSLYYRQQFAYLCPSQSHGYTDFFSIQFFSFLDDGKNVSAQPAGPFIHVELTSGARVRATKRMTIECAHTQPDQVYCRSSCAAMLSRMSSIGFYASSATHTQLFTSSLLSLFIFADGVCERASKAKRRATFRPSLAP